MIGKLAFLGAEYLRRSESLRILRDIEGEPHLPKDIVLTRQFERLTRLLAHAEQTVPYYRELFADLRITSRDIRSFDDFSRLPVLTKETVRERSHDLISTAADPKVLQAHHSGGSTGQPLTFYHDPASIALSDAGTYRNLQQAGWRAGDMIAFFWGWNKKLYSMSKLEFEARQWLRRQYQFDSFRAGDDAFEKWVTVWARIRPKVAYGYASAIARFADFILATGRSISPPRGVFTTAEKLLPGQRRSIEHAFGCQVYDCYGSSEVRNIASQCGNGGMHVNADLVVLETLNQSDDVSSPRPFVVTSLHSYAMPFIRYRNDDCGVLLDSTCPCGSGFPLMKLDIARSSDHFTMPDGRLVHGLFFIHRLYGSTGVSNFQFHQTDPHHILLYAVRAPGVSGFDASVERAIRDINALLPRDVVIEVREVTSIPLSAAGKHRYVRSDVVASDHSSVIPLPLED